MWERRAPAWGQNKSAALPASASLPVMLPCDQTFNTVWQSYLQEHTLNSTTTAILLWGRWYDVWSECTCYCQEAHVRSRSSVSNTYRGRQDEMWGVRKVFAAINTEGDMTGSDFIKDSNHNICIKHWPTLAQVTPYIHICENCWSPLFSIFTIITHTIKNRWVSVSHRNLTLPGWKRCRPSTDNKTPQWQKHRWKQDCESSAALAALRLYLGTEMLWAKC